ncbi:MAG: rhamnulokinase [Streptosporangiales bacterium]|nr:rhamnulokinase [Streptosporangiales bacterium]
MTRNVVAVDLGAESGRVVLARYDGQRVDLDVVHRFANASRQSEGLLRWDLGGIWREIRAGLRAIARTDAVVDSIGVAGWGVDYGFLDAGGRIIDDPVAYRDGRIRGVLAEAERRVGRDRLYRSTGIQLMEINTVYQQLAEARTAAGRQRQAAGCTMLFVPDLLHHLMCGSSVAEHTMATTSGMYDVVGRRWAIDLLDDLGLPTAYLPDVVDAGTDLGALQGDPADAAAFRRTRVVAPGTHDTASAVVGVPLADPAAAYVSSGTWSLVGVESATPVVTDAAFAANLTNEGGVYRTTRLLRNVMGLWLLQECRRQWEREGQAYDYPTLARMAEAETPAASLVDPDVDEFVLPGDMPARVRAHLSRTGQPIPETPGALVRCVLESLALRYRMVLDDLAAVTSAPVTGVHVVGGGSRNALLNTLTAYATGLPVRVGPVEATAFGNVLVQLGTLGELCGLAEMREVVRVSDPPQVVEPRPDAATDERYARFRALVGRPDMSALGARLEGDR